MKECHFNELSLKRAINRSKTLLLGPSNELSHSVSRPCAFIELSSYYAVTLPEATFKLIKISAAAYNTLFHKLTSL